MTNTNQPSPTRAIVTELDNIRRRITGRTSSNPQGDYLRAVDLLKDLHIANPQLAWSYVFVQGTPRTWKARRK